MSLAAAIIAGAAGTAASSLGSSIINGAISQDQAGKSRDLSWKETQYSAEQAWRQANAQRKWEEKMSNTAYQRAIADMQAAGLNPASLVGSGDAASTPSSSIPSGHVAGASGHSNFTGAKLDFGSSMFNSAVNAMIAKNPKEAAKDLGSAIVDNAEVAHKIEEWNEVRDAYFSKKLAEDASRAARFEAYGMASK